MLPGGSGLVELTAAHSAAAIARTPESVGALSLIRFRGNSPKEEEQALRSPNPGSKMNTVMVSSLTRGGMALACGVLEDHEVAGA